MPITQQELGRRLKMARESCGMSQEDIGRCLDLSRPTIAQIEAGARPVSTIEVSRLAYHFGRDLRDFLSESFEEQDALSVLFRADPEVASGSTFSDELRQCTAFGRELVNLKTLLGVGVDRALPSFPMEGARDKWSAIQQGYRLADAERQRLGLGYVPIMEIAELIEGQGVVTAERNLPDDIFGITLADRRIGILVVVNLMNTYTRRRFSYAHEYAHVLMDRSRYGLVSRNSDKENLIEVRANAFAAAFLMPSEGVRGFIGELGKGRPSRMSEDVFDEVESTLVRSRTEPGSQTIQYYDVALLAAHFGVSPISAIYRLQNLGIISKSEGDVLRERERASRGQDINALLGIEEPDHRALRNRFRRKFMGICLEAFRREFITRGKLRELAHMADVHDDELEAFLEAEGLLQDESSSVLLPG